MPTKTSNGTGGGLWSAGATWVGGVAPVDDDTVVIAAGDTVTFESDLSAWTGINGMTITGVLKLSRTTSGYLKMKAATTITGAGTFDCGTSGDAIPFVVKHTITGGAAWYINGAAGLTMTVYAAEPAIKTILLSGNEAIGQTELSVGTDITADIWADGDTIRIDDINMASESEERIIAAGGRAAGAITITVGLTAAKSTGAVMSLITRNVKIIAVGAGTQTLSGFTSGKLTVAGGMWYGVSKVMFNNCLGMAISGGSYSVNNYVLGTCTGSTISGGVFSGNTVVLNGVSLSISGGYFSGNTYVTNNSVGTSISGGTFKGNNNTIYGSNGCTITGGTFSGAATVSNICPGLIIYGGTFSGNQHGMYLSAATIKNATFSGNTNDITQSVVTCFNVTFGVTTLNLNYATLAREVYSESIDHNATPGAFKAWTRGGVTSSQAVTKPTGYTQANQTVLENAASEGFWQKEYTVGAGASVNIEMWLRKDAAMAYLPRCIIFNKAATDPFAGGAGIHTFTMTNSIDTWESETYTYYNGTASDVTLVIRFQGMNAANNMYSALTVEQINVDLTTVINDLGVLEAAIYNVSGTASAIKAKTDNLPSDPADESLLENILYNVSGTVTAIKTKTDQLIFTVPNQVDANALTGGGASAVAVRTEMDANSTKLADILTDTGTTLPAAIAAIDTDILNAIVEGTFTVQDVLKFMAGVLAGKSSGGGTGTVTFRDLSDALNRIVATVDANGNRTLVIRDNT